MVVVRLDGFSQETPPTIFKTVTTHRRCRHQKYTPCALQACSWMRYAQLTTSAPPLPHLPIDGNHFALISRKEKTKNLNLTWLKENLNCSLVAAFEWFYALTHLNTTDISTVHMYRFIHMHACCYFYALQHLIIIQTWLILLKLLMLKPIITVTWSPSPENHVIRHTGLFICAFMSSLRCY